MLAVEDIGIVESVPFVAVVESVFTAVLLFVEAVGSISVEDVESTSVGSIITSVLVPILEGAGVVIVVGAKAAQEVNDVARSCRSISARDTTASWIEVPKGADIVESNSFQKVGSTFQVGRVSGSILESLERTKICTEETIQKFEG